MMRLVMFIFPILHVVHVCVLDLLLFVVGRLSSVNLVIQMQKKR